GELGHDRFGRGAKPYPSTGRIDACRLALLPREVVLLLIGFPVLTGLLRICLGPSVLSHQEYLHVMPMGSNSTPERRNHEDVARAPTLGAPLAYCSKRHAAMPETRALASSHHRSAPSRGSPAPCVPVVLVDAIHARLSYSTAA